MKKLLAFTLTVTLSLSVLAGMFTVADAKALSELPKVPLNYMDEDSDWKAATDTTHTSPVAFQGTLSTANYAGGTRVTGGNQDDLISAAKAADDTYFKLETVPKTARTDHYIEIFTAKSPSVDRYVMQAGENNVITVSMDVASPDITTGYTKNLFTCETNAGVTATSGNKWGPSAGVNTQGKFGSGTMQDNTWHNITYEIGSAENEKAVKYFLDGVEVGTQALDNSNLGLVRTGVQAAAPAAGSSTTVQRIYYDNVYVNVGEPYTTARYLANKDAAALNFTHFKGDNTAKDEISSNLNLNNIAGMSEGTVITWQSSNPSVINAETGVITPQLANTDVTLTATITNDGKSNTKTFTVTVLEKQASLEEIDAAKALLKPLLDENADKTADNFTAESFAAFTAAKEAAQTAYDKTTDASVTELNEAREALAAAVDGLVLSVSAPYGTITHDSYTEKQKPNTPMNFNDDGQTVKETVTAKGGYNDAMGNTSRIVYIGVDMTNLSIDADRIVLKMHTVAAVSNPNSSPFSIYETSEFDETTLTYGNKPALGALIDTVNRDGLAANPGWLVFDVTDYAKREKEKGNTSLWLAFTSADKDNSSVSFHSKEASEESKRPIFMAENNTLRERKDADLNAIDMNALLGIGDTLDSVTQDLKTLPTTGSLFGYTITWTSSNPDIIDAAGKVTMPAETTAVTLTAAVNEDGVVHEKAFNLTVKVLSDIEEEANRLTFDTIKGENTAETAVFSKLTLVDTGEKGSSISWKSSDAHIIDDNGNVTRDALANAKDVTLTATIGTGDGAVTKEFNLRVYGDKYVVDNADATVPVEVTSGLAVTTESNWRMVGYTHTANGLTGQYLVYRAAEGFDFTVNTITAAKDKEVTFAVSADGVNYTPFINVEKADSKREFGTAGGHDDRVYNSTAVLPAGTRFLKVNFPDVDRAWKHRITSVEIFKKDNAEITFADIKQDNYDGKTVISALNLPNSFADGSSISWASSNTDVIADNGAIVARPAADTEVTLTAMVTNGASAYKKVYPVTVKAFTVMPEILDIPFAYRRLSTVSLIDKNCTLSKGTKICASIDAVNLTNADKDLTMVLAVYSTDGTPLDVNYEKVTFSNTTGAPQHKEISLTLSNETENIYSGCTVKAFVWDDNGLTPVCDGFVSVAKQTN